VQQQVLLLLLQARHWLLLLLLLPRLRLRKAVLGLLLCLVMRLWQQVVHVWVHLHKPRWRCCARAHSLT
jgi:hypothetical protein